MTNICEVLFIHKITHFLTGSRAFFPDNKLKSSAYDDEEGFFAKLKGEPLNVKDDRDWDVCILNQDFENVEKIIYSLFDVQFVHDCPYSRGKLYNLKAEISDERFEVNIIPLTVAQFLSWHFATNSMMQFEPSKYRNKETRIRAFELLCLASKDMYGYNNVSFAGNGGNIDATFQIAKESIRKHIKNIGDVKTNIIIA